MHTPKIRTPRSAIIDGNEQVQIAIMKIVHNAGIKVSSSASYR